jgi:tetratricopeptide (TPR) repeat protein
VLNDALQINPHNVAALGTRGILFLKNNQLEEAVDDFTKAMAYSPPQKKSYYFERGRAFVHLQKYRSAYIDLKIALNQSLARIESDDVTEAAVLADIWTYLGANVD